MWGRAVRPPPPKPLQIIKTRFQKRIEKCRKTENSSQNFGEKFHRNFNLFHDKTTLPQNFLKENKSIAFDSNASPQNPNPIASLVKPYHRYIRRQLSTLVWRNIGHGFHRWLHFLFELRQGNLDFGPLFRFDEYALFENDMMG